MPSKRAIARLSFALPDPLIIPNAKVLVAHPKKLIIEGITIMEAAVTTAISSVNIRKIRSGKKNRRSAHMVDIMAEMQITEMINPSSVSSIGLSSPVP